jgi:hypothetical protein
MADLLTNDNDDGRWAKKTSESYDRAIKPPSVLSLKSMSNLLSHYSGISPMNTYSGFLSATSHGSRFNVFFGQTEMGFYGADIKCKFETLRLSKSYVQ